MAKLFLFFAYLSPFMMITSHEKKHVVGTSLTREDFTRNEDLSMKGYKIHTAQPACFFEKQTQALMSLGALGLYELLVFKT